MFFQSIEKKLQRISIEWICMLFMLCSGTILCFLTPPYQVLDEPTHFARAWQISEGVFISPAADVQDILEKSNPMSRKHIEWNGGANAFPKKMLGANIPSSIMPMDMIDIDGTRHFTTWERNVRFMEEPLNPSRREFFFLPNTGPYAPFLYMPQALAAFLGRSLDCSAGIIFYLMRLGALMFVSICVFLSMRLLPEKKFLIFLLAVMPMFMIEAASVSADPVVYGLCFLAATYLFSLRKQREQFHNREIFSLICLAVILGMTKQIYGVILIIYLVIPWQRMGDRFKYWMFGIGLLFLCFASSLGWLYFTVYSKGIESVTWVNMDTTAQKEFMLQYPFIYLEILIRSIYIQGLDLVKNFVGVFGWGKFMIPDWFFWPYILSLGVGGMAGKLGISMCNRILFLLTIVFFTVMIFTAEYIIWTETGSDVIKGVQGRYFIPVALLFFVSLSCRPALKLEHTLAVQVGLVSTATLIRITLAGYYGL